MVVTKTGMGWGYIQPMQIHMHIAHKLWQWHILFTEELEWLHN